MLRLLACWLISKPVGIHCWLRKVIRCAYAYKILAAAPPHPKEDGSRESLEAG